MPETPIIELRRIEANVIKPIYEEMAAELGEDAARRILRAAIRRNAIEQGRTLAAESQEPAGIAGFAKLLDWSAGRPMMRCAWMSWSRTTNASTSTSPDMGNRSVMG